MSTGWTCGRQLISECSCAEWRSLERVEEAGGSLPQSAQGKWMTVTLPSGQLTVILAVGLTCWPYLSYAVCLIISGREDLICVCKVDRWPSGKGNKGHSSSTVYFFRATPNMSRSLLGIWGCRRREILWDWKSAICYYFQLLPNLPLYLPVKWH